MDVGCRRRRRRTATLRIEMLRAEPAARQVDDDGLDLDLRHPLGRVDGLADGGLGGLEVDDAPPLRPSERWWPMPMMRATMRAAAQRFDLVDGLQLGDEADDLARADVEHREGRALARRERLQARRQTVTARRSRVDSLAALGFFFIASARADAASSVSRTTTRSGMRRSIARTSLSRIFCSRSSRRGGQRLPSPRVPAGARRGRCPSSGSSAGRRRACRRALRLFRGPAASRSREVVAWSGCCACSPTTAAGRRSAASCMRSMTVPSGATTNNSPFVLPERDRARARRA